MHSVVLLSTMPATTWVVADSKYWTSESFQWVIGCSCRLLNSSTSLADDALTKALVWRAPQFISYPIDNFTMINNNVAFHSVARFPNVLGLLTAPTLLSKPRSVNEEAYVNQKGVHTLNVQAVYDMDIKCLHSTAKWVRVYAVSLFFLLWTAVRKTTARTIFHISYLAYVRPFLAN